MKGRKHSPEQIIRKLREADRLLAEGKANAEVAKALEVTEWTLIASVAGYAASFGYMFWIIWRRLHISLRLLLAPQPGDVQWLKGQLLRRLPGPRS